MININETYAITSNPNNLVLVKKNIIQTGKNAGEVSYTNAGYYTSYESLYHGLLKMEQSNNSHASLKQAVEEIKEISDQALKAILLHKCGADNV